MPNAPVTGHKHGMAEQTPEDLEAQYGDYQLAPPSGAFGPTAAEQLESELLAQIAKRYFPLGMSDPDPAFLQAMARRELEREFAKKFPDEALSDYLGDDGRFAARPTIAWDNPVAREIARAEYREGGPEALANLDPGYEAYRGFEPGSDLEGYDAHLLPPGYADYLRAERDYDILRMMQEPGADLTATRLRAAMGGDAPFSRYANLGTEYYPRFYGQGVSNALSSGTDAPVAAGLSVMQTVPNALYYAADDSLRPDEAGIPYLGVPANPLPRIGRSVEKAIRELGRTLGNRSLGREVQIADVPVGTPELAKTADVLEEVDRRSQSVPAQNTDLVRNLTGLNVPPVIGDIADFGVNYLDGTPVIGGLADLANTARAAANAGESVSRAVGSQLRNDAFIDMGTNAGITAALPPQERSWSDYLFKPVTERMAPPPEEISKAAMAEEPKFSYGTPSGARDLVSGSFLSPGTQLPADQRQEAYRASPGRIQELVEEKRKRDAKRASSFDAADFIGGMKY